MAFRDWYHDYWWKRLIIGIFSSGISITVASFVFLGFFIDSYITQGMEGFTRGMLAGFIVCLIVGAIVLTLGIFGIKTLNEEAGGKSSASLEKVEYADAIKRMQQNEHKKNKKEEQKKDGYRY